MIVKKYKLIIVKIYVQYTSKKENDKANAFSKKNDYMNNKKVINHNILKINRDESLSTNTKKLKTTLRILRDDQKQYFIKREKFQIS